MSSFLLVFSKGKVIYEADVDAAGNVSIPRVLPDLSTADKVQIIDSRSQIQLQFSVYGGSLAGSQLWQKIDFRTRCFLTPDGVDEVAPVSLRLDSAGQIRVTAFTIFGQDATPGSPQVPIALSALAGTVFVFAPSLSDLGVLSFGTPDLLVKLGIHTDITGNNNQTPTFTCSPGPAGTNFSLTAPLSSGDQTLTPYGIEFDTKTFSGFQTGFGGSPVFSVAQSESVLAATQEPFWNLEVDFLPPGIVLQAWNNKIAYPFLYCLNTTRSGLPASFVPTLQANAGETAFFNTTFVMVDRTSGKSRLANTDFVFREPVNANTNGLLNIITGTVTLGPAPLNCVANFRNLERADGLPLQAACILTASVVQTNSICQNTSGFCFGFQHQFDGNAGAASQAVVRMGALDLHLPLPSGTSTIPSETGTIHASFRTTRNAPNADDVAYLVRLDQLSIKLAVSALGIGGQDDSPGSEYAPPNQPFPRCNASSYRRAPSLQFARTPQTDFPSPGAYFYYYWVIKYGACLLLLATPYSDEI
jgi:hypothetical protein